MWLLISISFCHSLWGACEDTKQVLDKFPTLEACDHARESIRFGVMYCKEQANDK